MNEAEAQRKHQRVGPAARIESVSDIFKVKANGPRRDFQPVGDLTIFEPLHQAGQTFLLSRGKDRALAGRYFLIQCSNRMTLEVSEIGTIIWAVSLLDAGFGLVKRVRMRFISACKIRTVKGSDKMSAAQRREPKH